MSNMPAVKPGNSQAIFFRRRHQPRRPPPAKIRPGRPAPAIGPGTDPNWKVASNVALVIGPLPQFSVAISPFALTLKEIGLKGKLSLSFVSPLKKPGSDAINCTSVGGSLMVVVLTRSSNVRLVEVWKVDVIV